MDGRNAETYGYDEFGVNLHDSFDLQPFGYTGYMNDSIADMQFAQAREYMPEHGRFAAQDRIKGVTFSPASLNAYVFVGSMPFKYYDPDGMIWHVLIGAGVGAVVGGVTEFGSQLWDQVKSGKGINLKEINYGKVTASFIGGGITGGLTAAGVPGPVASGIGGFAEGTLKAHAEGKSWGTSLKEGAVSGVTSAAFSAAGEGLKHLTNKGIIPKFDLRNKLPGRISNSPLNTASEYFARMSDTFNNRINLARAWGGFPGWSTIGIGIIAGFGDELEKKLNPMKWPKGIFKKVTKKYLKCLIAA